MRPLFLAVVLLSCAGDPARRSPEPQRTSESRSAEPAAPSEIHPTPAPSSPPPAALVADRTPPPPPPDPRAQVRQTAHDALAEHCGECHEGHRSNAPKALAVFDLDLPDWPRRFNDQRFESALRRLAQKPEPARTAFLAFRDAERAASAAQPGASAAVAN